MGFEFYFMDLLNNAPFLFQSLLKMCAAGLATCAVIVVVDYFQWSRWLAHKKD
jgi:hypothetical protein